MSIITITSTSELLQSMCAFYTIFYSELVKANQKFSFEEVNSNDEIIWKVNCNKWNIGEDNDDDKNIEEVNIDDKITEVVKGNDKKTGR